MFSTAHTGCGTFSVDITCLSKLLPLRYFFSNCSYKFSLTNIIRLLTAPLAHRKSLTHLFIPNNQHVRYFFTNCLTNFVTNRTGSVVYLNANAVFTHRAGKFVAARGVLGAPRD